MYNKNAAITIRMKVLAVVSFFLVTRALIYLRL